jgi:hypothetical protein
MLGRVAERHNWLPKIVLRSLVYLCNPYTLCLTHITSHRSLSLYLSIYLSVRLPIFFSFSFFFCFNSMTSAASYRWPTKGQTPTGHNSSSHMTNIHTWTMSIQYLVRSYMDLMCLNAWKKCKLTQSIGQPLPSRSSLPKSMPIPSLPRRTWPLRL